MPTLSVTLPSFGPIFRDNNFHQIADLAQMAEQAGVDRIMLTDHVVMGQHTDKYPYGPFPFHRTLLGWSRWLPLPTWPLLLGG